MWGATSRVIYGRLFVLFQSTRPVWGATIRTARKTTTSTISIHAPRVGRDYTTTLSPTGTYKFQSTRPVWGATLPYLLKLLRINISIHAPRVGRDCFWNSEM